MECPTTSFAASSITRRRSRGSTMPLVTLDFTKPEDQFPDPNYGGEYLKETLLRLLPDAYRQTLLRLKEATDALKDVHLRHAVPVIMGYSTMAATAGAVPVPFVDMIIIPGIQARMAHHLAGLYGQPMTTDRFKEIAAAVGVGMVSRQLARQATKFIPVVGSAVGAAIGGASTYALGRGLCYYFQAACEGHVPDAASLKASSPISCASGLRRWTQSGGWTTLTTANVEHAVLSFDGLSVAADFGKGGLKLYETGWVLLSTLDPEQIAIGLNLGRLRRGVTSSTSPGSSSIVRFSPSSRPTFGSQPRSFLARVMSGWRTFGSSCGNGLVDDLALAPPRASSLPRRTAGS